ncbi:MAG: succinate--CoA ligase subunit alpha [Kiloniellales bacterium]
MAVLIDADTKVVCQGITGRQATFHCEQAISYGTRLVAGVTPGKGGKRHLGLPVFEKVAEAVKETGATASLVFVPPRNAAAAMIEAIEADVPLVVCVTERIPVLDMVRVKERLADSRTRLIGPNSAGIIAPGQAKIGVMPAHLHVPGKIGLVSRSASLAYEAAEQLTRWRLGQSTAIGIGGDPVTGLGFVECIELFLADPQTEGIVMLGEIGGDAEEEAAAFIAKAKPRKPIVAYVAGLNAPTGQRMGHAGTITLFGSGDAAAKIAALEAAGAIVAANAAVIGRTMRQALVGPAG